MIAGRGGDAGPPSPPPAMEDSLSEEGGRWESPGNGGTLP